MKIILAFKNYTVFLTATVIIPWKKLWAKQTNGQGHVLRALSTGTGFGQRAIIV